MEVLRLLMAEHNDPAISEAFAVNYLNNLKTVLIANHCGAEFTETLELVSKDPGFLGILLERDAMIEYSNLRAKGTIPGSYFIHLTYGSQGRFTVCGAVEIKSGTGGVRSNHLGWNSIQKEIADIGGIPFDRRKCRVYAQTAKTRATGAIECWIVCAKRLRVVRDIRVLIAKLLWANKHEWIYLQQ